MKTTPKQFAHLLAHSTLSEKERQLILDQLPSLDEKQIENIAKLLKYDAKEKAKLLKQIEVKEEQMLTNIEVQMKQAQAAHEEEIRKASENTV